MLDTQAAAEYCMFLHEAETASAAGFPLSAASSYRKALSMRQGLPSSMNSSDLWLESTRLHELSAESFSQFLQAQDAASFPCSPGPISAASTAPKDQVALAASTFSVLSFLGCPTERSPSTCANAICGKRAVDLDQQPLKTQRIETSIIPPPPHPAKSSTWISTSSSLGNVIVSKDSVVGTNAYAFNDESTSRVSRRAPISALSKNPNQTADFLTASEHLHRDIVAGKVPNIPQMQPQLGLRRFQPPFQQSVDKEANVPHPTNQIPVSKVISATHKPPSANQKNAGDSSDESSVSFPESLLLPDGSVPPILQPCDPKLVHQICLEIVESATKVDWDDIAGLEHAKQSVDEAVVWPLSRPELFTGLRSSYRGLLLFGPPGTGKTMIARAIASRAQCTFLNISASSLMSKWVGDGEKMVRCLFAVAAVKQPSVVFIDEIDSLLSMRGEGEMDAVRRVKTEFLVQLDGVTTSANNRVLLIGATNRPEELDEAARRRLEKRLYIPLPDEKTRMELITRLMTKEGNPIPHTMRLEDFMSIAVATDGYSGADLNGVCREAAMGPLRSVKGFLTSVSLGDIRPVEMKDFQAALKRQKPSVGKNEVGRYEKWNSEFGSFNSADENE